MITIQAYGTTNSTQLISDINSDNSILLIGKGSDETNLNDFIKPRNFNEMKKIYGECELTEAYLSAIEAGASNVFVMNCRKITDFVDCIPFISHYNFAYVVPIGIYLADKFLSKEYNREMYFSEYYLCEFSKNTNTTLIFTERHADLYQNIDHYLIDMRSKVIKLRNEIEYILDINGESLIFCTNNIKDDKWASIQLAASLGLTSPGKYPSTINKKCVFDLDSEDIFSNEIVYFKNNFVVNSSIENLKNLRTVFDANKIVSINSVIKKIERSLDTSFIKGKLFNDYLKMELHDYIDNYFRKMLGSHIENYAIGNINHHANEDMTVTLTVDIDIYPLNSLESISTKLEV